MTKLVIFLSLVAAHLSSGYANDIYFFDDYSYSCGDARADNSTTTAFKTNLNSLLTALEEKGPQNYGFYKTTVGKSPDKLYGLVQCRGDVSSQDCSTCLKDSVEKATTKCKNGKDMAVWYDRCFLHYTNNHKFFGQWQWDGGSTLGYSPHVNASPDGANVVSNGMNFMSMLASDVSNEPSLFLTGELDMGKHGKRYGLVQCNRDLKKSSCTNCTRSLIDCYNMVIGNYSSYIVNSYGCRLWYDSYKFYSNDTLPSNSKSGTPSSTSPKGLQISFVLATAVLLLLLIIQN